MVLLLSAAGCTTAPKTPPAEDPWETRWVSPEEILGSRMAAFTCEDDPARPEGTLNLWLDLLGDQGVRERSAGMARLLDSPASDRREFDYLLHWRPCSNGIEVQTTAPSGLGGDFCRQALQSMAFAMEARGIRVEYAESSGCLPPGERPPGSRNHGEAIEAAFREIGLVELKDSPEMDANISWYGPPGGAREWHADWILVGGGSEATVELFHDAVPFDAKGERDLLARYLRLMGVVPWGLGADGKGPKSPDQDEGQPLDRGNQRK